MKVGDQLWYVPAKRHGDPSYVTVDKVGRKWLSLSNMERVDAESLIADGKGYNSPGAAYHSREAWEMANQLRDAWGRFQALARKHWAVPDGVTINQIDNACRSLFGVSAKETGSQSC
jgi:hypothetical protein